MEESTPVPQVPEDVLRTLTEAAALLARVTSALASQQVPEGIAAGSWGFQGEATGRAYDVSIADHIVITDAVSSELNRAALSRARNWLSSHRDAFSKGVAAAAGAWAFDWAINGGAEKLLDLVEPLLDK